MRTLINRLTTKKRNPLIFGLVFLLLASAAAKEYFSGPDRTAGLEAREQPVGAAAATVVDVPVYLQGLGSVTPVNTTLVKSRVDGQLLSLHFTEGQPVQAGDLLAVIDPRPFEVQLLQAQGAYARDAALLRNAQIDLERYRKLEKEGSVSKQQLQAQESLVGQYEGALLIDTAAIEDAQLQLTYSRITAPISGKLGLKQADVGNMVRASDAQGIVVITQTDPMQVVFSLVEKDLPLIRQALAGPQAPPVEAWDQDNKRLLASGVLESMDNQVDTSTGTVKLKALFTGSDDVLFPKQFVNARLLATTLRGVTAVPNAAVQRNSEGAFVYVAKQKTQEAGQNGGGPNDGGEGGDEESGGGSKETPAPGGTRVPGDEKKLPEKQHAYIIATAEVRQVTIGYSTADLSVVEDGLQPGEIVVTDGVDRLRNNAPIRFIFAPLAEGGQ